MTQNGDVYQNAVAERVNGILKRLSSESDICLDTASHQSVKQSISIYNTERPHLSLGYQTPQAVYQKTRQQLSIKTVICTFLCKSILGLDISRWAGWKPAPTQ